jgi:pyruvate formate lyase activating enzyme
MDKRTFVKGACMAVTGAFCIPGLSAISREMKSGKGKMPGELWKWSKESMHYEVTPRGTKCMICPNECTLKAGETSQCKNRINHSGKLYTIAYGDPCAMNIDPIEKKPFFHFLPGSNAFSIATAGCNFACLNCQNWTISQSSPKETQNYDLMPDKVVEQAVLNKCKSIAYTYSEPITFYEYVYDTATLARKRGIRNVLVSNGYINEQPLRFLCKVIDGATIDLKSFDNATYLKLNAGMLQPVLDSLKVYKQEGVWLEISNLIIPSWSDNMDMIQKMCDWLFQNGFQDTPLHFLRFQPLYKLSQLPPTPVPVLQKAKEIAIKAGIKYVYIGNIPGTNDITTKCPHCGKLVIERNGHVVISNHTKGGKCEYCGTSIPGRWA